MKSLNRKAVRAIILTPGREVLLMRIRNPITLADFWICPGGGIEENENLSAALGRELKEEVGLTDFGEHHKVHLRHHVFRWREKIISQHETFFLVSAKKFQPVISDPVEAQSLQEFRWWPLAELDSAEHPITPKSLYEIVANFLKNGPPVGELSLESTAD